MSKKTVVMMMAASLTAGAAAHAVAADAKQKWDPFDKDKKPAVKAQVMEQNVKKPGGDVKERKLQKQGGEVMENNAAKKLQTNNGIQKRVGPGPVA